jgi:hypothetical protein
MIRYSSVAVAVPNFYFRFTGADLRDYATALQE